jgi:hypothetical protein
MIKPTAEIIMINTYGANHRWMIPGNQEYSHSMTQNIPGKQVLVRMHDTAVEKQQQELKWAHLDASLKCTKLLDIVIDQSA